MKKLYNDPELKFSLFLDGDVVLSSVNEYDNANITDDGFTEDWFSSL